MLVNKSLNIPFSRTWHTTNAQVLTNGLLNGIAPTPVIYLGPIFSMNTVSGVIINTPDPYVLFEVFGGYNRVQNGDVFVIPIFSLSGSASPLIIQNSTNPGPPQQKIIPTNSGNTLIPFVSLVITFNVAYEDTDGSEIVTYNIS